MKEKHRTLFNYTIDILLVSCSLYLFLFWVRYLLHVADVQIDHMFFGAHEMRRLACTVAIVLPILFFSTIRKGRTPNDTLCCAAIPYGVYLLRILAAQLSSFWVVFFFILALSYVIAWYQFNKQQRWKMSNITDVARQIFLLVTMQELVLFLLISAYKLFLVSMDSKILIGLFILNGFYFRWIYGYIRNSLVIQQNKDPTILRQSIADTILKECVEIGDPLWKGLSIDGRKDLICKIAAIESGFLGMNTTPHIHFRSMQKGTIRYAPFIKKQGFYRPTNRRIYISKDLLLRKTAWSILESLFHELAHACQHSMIQYIQEPHEEKISPFFIQKASIYEQEFQNYCDTNSTTYRQQICEIDAQRFAIETLREYQIIVERIK